MGISDGSPVYVQVSYLLMNKLMENNGRGELNDSNYFVEHSSIAML